MYSIILLFFLFCDIFLVNWWYKNNSGRMIWIRKKILRRSLKRGGNGQQQVMDISIHRFGSIIPLHPDITRNHVKRKDIFLSSFLASNISSFNWIIDRDHGNYQRGQEWSMERRSTLKDISRQKEERRAMSYKNWSEMKRERENGRGGHFVLLLLSGSSLRSKII